MAPPPAFFMEKDLHPVDYGCIGKFTLFLPMLRRLPANCSSCGTRSHSSGCAFGSPPGLTIPRVSGENSYTPSLCGPVAQLGARFHGMEEVVGSIPTRSTNLFNCGPLRKMNFSRWGSSPSVSRAGQSSYRVSRELLSASIDAEAPVHSICFNRWCLP